MSVLAMDSFDWNGTTIITNRYHSTSGTPAFSNAQTKHGSGASLLLNTNEYVTFDIGDQSGNVIIIGFYIYFTAIYASSDTSLLVIKDSVNLEQCSVRLDKTTHKLKIVKYNVLLGTGSQVLSLDTWYHVEFKLKVVNSTASGECILKIDGVEDMNLVGVDTQYGVTDSVETISIYSFNGTTLYYDDFYVLDTVGSYANDFIGPYIRIECLLPDGNGNSNDFVGSDSNSVDNYLHVDEATADDDSSYIQSSTVGHKDGYSFDDLGGSVDAVMAVQTMTRHKKVSGAGSRTAKHFIRRSAADYDGDITHTLSDGTYENDVDLWTEDPSTIAQWTETNVNALEAGLKVQT
ncbi:hypothetical protein LCGC14_1307140 [marine sediment metagenome]|uniref:Uncharacterized protein n=1 Tax=marine sediment metagenome TaxID=412755 RepID=A0A0F9N4L9_9ZZZZ